MSAPAGASATSMKLLVELVGPGLAGRVDEAVRALRATKGTARVVVDADGDGLNAGAILLRALRREGRAMHLSGLRGLDAAAGASIRQDAPPVVITADLGSGQLDVLAPIADSGTPVIILDHHVPPSPRSDSQLIQVNGHLFGVDGTLELCGASTSLLFAIGLNAANLDLAPNAIAGAIADRQHVGGFRGAAKRIVEAAQSAGSVRVRRGLNLDGANVLDALVRSNDPFLPGITGDEARARQVLREVGAAPETKVDDLTDEQARALASRLVTLLIGHGVDPVYAQEVTTLRVFVPGLGMTAKDLQALVNSAGRVGEHATAVAAALGQRWALERAQKAADDYRRQVRAGLLELSANPPKKLRAVQVFDIDNALVAAAVAGLGMVYLFDPEFPVVCFTPSGGGWKVSTRATRRQLERGVNFATAARKAAEAVGGRGGGHPVASGATIPLEGRERFLALLDELVAEQVAAGKPVAGAY